MHLVVPLSRFSSHDDLELRYMLRSARCHFRDLDQVLIVGHRPSWLREVEGLRHVPAEDPHRWSKDSNIIDKILLACRELQDDFLVNSDDQIFCSDACAYDLWSAWLVPDQEHVIAQAETKRNYSLWHDRLLLTLDECRRRQWPEWVVECHVPYPVDHEWYPRLMSGLDYRDGNGLLTHIYLNAYHAEAWPRRLEQPTIHLESLTMLFKRSVGLEEAHQAIASHRFVGFNENGFSDGMRHALAERFPDPSPWES